MLDGGDTVCDGDGFLVRGCLLGAAFPPVGATFPATFFCSGLADGLTTGSAAALVLRDGGADVLTGGGDGSGLTEDVLDFGGDGEAVGESNCDLMAPKFLPDRVLVNWILPGGGPPDAPVLGLLGFDPDSKMEILSISLDLLGDAIFSSTIKDGMARRK